MKIKKEKLIIILFFVLMALFLISVILPRKLGNLDEIWNYNVAKNVAQGKLLYVDVSTIVTPLLPLICSVFLNIFGNHLIVMRFLQVLLHLIIFIASFGIFKKLKMNTYVSLIFIMLIAYLYNELFAIDYNFLTLAILLIIIYLELKQNNNETIRVNKKHDITVGLLAGICICTKQTTGILISLALIIYKFILIRNTQDLKEFGKGILYRAIGICIPLLVLTIYFSINGMWKDFNNYCISGIKEFTNKVEYKELLEKEMYIKLPAIIMPIFLIYLIFAYFRVRSKNTYYYNNLFTITPFAVAGTSVIYPIAEEGHFYIGMLPILIALIYAVYTVLKVALGKIDKTKKVKMFLKIFTQMGIVIFTISITFVSVIPKICKYVYATNKCYINHYELIPIDGLEGRIEEISQFILEQEKPVYILDSEAAVYKIPIDRYDKNYDIFLKGNLGAGGEDEQIQKIEKETNALYLIKKSQYGRNWQSPEKVINYMLKNYKKTGEISIYDIYENERK